jgi:cytochrome c556
MKRLRNFRFALALCSVLAIVIATIAATQAAMKSANPVADRQRLMKLIGASWADIQAKVKAGNAEAVAVNAETLAVSAGHIPPLFPAGSMTDQSKAKPEIWQKWPEFEAAAKNLETMSEKLRDAARAKDTAGVEAMVKEFGAKACGACHTPFRQPPKS